MLAGPVHNPLESVSPHCYPLRGGTRVPGRLGWHLIAGTIIPTFLAASRPLDITRPMAVFEIDWEAYLRGELNVNTRRTRKKGERCFLSTFALGSPLVIPLFDILASSARFLLAERSCLPPLSVSFQCKTRSGGRGVS